MQVECNTHTEMEGRGTRLEIRGRASHTEYFTFNENKKRKEWESFCDFAWLKEARKVFFVRVINLI